MKTTGIRGQAILSLFYCMESTGLFLRVQDQPTIWACTAVDLNDGSYSRTMIYPVYGIGESREQHHPIGKFYVQFNGQFCAYDLPGGAIAMQFLPAPAGTPPGFNGFVPFPDGAGGVYLEGTFELTIGEATRVYESFANGHNYMVDRLHHLANGNSDEFCFLQRQPISTSVTGLRERHGRHGAKTDTGPLFSTCCRSVSEFVGENKPNDFNSIEGLKLRRAPGVVEHLKIGLKPSAG